MKDFIRDPLAKLDSVFSREKQPPEQPPVEADLSEQKEPDNQPDANGIGIDSLKASIDNLASALDRGSVKQSAVNDNGNVESKEPTNPDASDLFQRAIESIRSVFVSDKTKQTNSEKTTDNTASESQKDSFESQSTSEKSGFQKAIESIRSVFVSDKSSQTNNQISTDTTSTTNSRDWANLGKTESSNNPEKSGLQSVLESIRSVFVADKKTQTNNQNTTDKVESVNSRESKENTTNNDSERSVFQRAIESIRSVFVSDKTKQTNSEKTTDNTVSESQKDSFESRSTSEKSGFQKAIESIRSVFVSNKSEKQIESNSSESASTLGGAASTKSVIEKLSPENLQAQTTASSTLSDTKPPVETGPKESQTILGSILQTLQQILGKLGGSGGSSSSTSINSITQQNLSTLSSASKPERSNATNQTTAATREATAGESASTLGGAASGVGAVVVGAAMATKALVQFAQTTTATTTSMVESQRHLADVNGQLAGAFAQRDIREFRRDMDSAKDTQGGTRQLIGSEQNLKDVTQPIENLLTNVSNVLQTGVADTLAEILEPVASIARLINAYVKDKFVNDNRGGNVLLAGDFVRSVQAEDQRRRDEAEQKIRDMKEVGPFGKKPPPKMPDLIIQPQPDFAFPPINQPPAIIPQEKPFDER